MNNHIYRPLFVTLAALGILFILRNFLVPRDFKTHERGFRYSYYRDSNEGEWKNFKVKYQSKDYCADCHDEEYKKNVSSAHKIIQCENCHGPAIDHPENPEKLVIDTSRALCLRCHMKLPYPTSLRSTIKGIDPKTHEPDSECSLCHDPHQPSLEK